MILPQTLCFAGCLCLPNGPQGNRDPAQITRYTHFAIGDGFGVHTTSSGATSLWCFASVQRCSKYLLRHEKMNPVDTVLKLTGGYCRRSPESNSRKQCIWKRSTAGSELVFPVFRSCSTTQEGLDLEFLGQGDLPPS